MWCVNASGCIWVKTLYRISNLLLLHVHYPKGNSFKSSSLQIQPQSLAWTALPEKHISEPDNNHGLFYCPQRCQLVFSYLQDWYSWNQTHRDEISSTGIKDCAANIWKHSGRWQVRYHKWLGYGSQERMADLFWLVGIISEEWSLLKLK